MKNITISSSSRSIIFSGYKIFGVLIQYILSFFKNYELTTLKYVFKRILLTCRNKNFKNSKQKLSQIILFVILFFNYQTENMLYICKK